MEKKSSLYRHLVAEPRDPAHLVINSFPGIPRIPTRNTVNREFEKCQQGMPNLQQAKERETEVSLRIRRKTCVKSGFCRQEAAV
jgi:hypothetical protein